MSKWTAKESGKTQAFVPKFLSLMKKESWNIFASLFLACMLISSSIKISSNFCAKIVSTGVFCFQARRFRSNFIRRVNFFYRYKDFFIETYAIPPLSFNEPHLLNMARGSLRKNSWEYLKDYILKILGEVFKSIIVLKMKICPKFFSLLDWFNRRKFDKI